MIEVQNLSKTFGEIDALNKVSFTVESGKIVGFLGANGAGKTTTMDIICGCGGADQGSVKVSGYDIFDNPVEAKKNIGYLPDEPPLHDDMKVKEFLPYVARLRGVTKQNLKKSYDKVVEQLSLQEVQNRLIGNLSKGYRQRVAFAQAIIHNPSVLVLDEPTEGLDPNQILQIRNLIKELAGEHTILLSSHILSEVENTCDEILIINKGEIVKRGTYSDIIRHKDASLIYRMRLNKSADGLVTVLNEISGASAHKIKDDLLELSIDSDDILDSIVERTLASGLALRELTPAAQSLENVFLQLTK